MTSPRPSLHLLDVPVPEPISPPPALADGRHTQAGFLTLAMGSLGVVFGDIGTSPLYAFHECMLHLVAPGQKLVRADVMGVVSLMFWALMIVVTFKYVLLLMRMDNKGEGGVLSLNALAEGALGGRTRFLLIMGILGASLFYGDALLTPAISVLSAVEGLGVIPSLQGHIENYILPIAVGVLIGLFLIQRRGTALLGAWFGPICLLWFAALAATGGAYVIRDPGIVAALSPTYAAGIFVAHPLLSFVLLGSVFLTVTGGEALYADMGHFGRRPINVSWLFVVLPCLALNYLGQGALVLADPKALENPFFLLAPAQYLPAFVALATMATIIASQAVISGAYSLTRQAMQLGLLPRLRIVQTSEHHVGQIYMPQVNMLLAIGVLLLVVIFKSSAALASAYGISVIGAMATSSVLAIVAVWKIWRRPLWFAVLLIAPFLLVETVFLASNMLKLFSGGYVPLLIAGAMSLVMSTWVHGAKTIADRLRSDTSMQSLLALLEADPPPRVRGTAIFLTADANVAPAALLHNLKHNQILHERIILLTVRTAMSPRVPDSDIVDVGEIAPNVQRLTLTFGFMQTPNVVRALVLAREQGLRLDLLKSSFFVSRRTVAPSHSRGWLRWRELLFIFLTRNAASATDFFHIPTSRVVELGDQVLL